MNDQDRIIRRAVVDSYKLILKNKPEEEEKLMTSTIELLKKACEINSLPYRLDTVNAMIEGIRIYQGFVKDMEKQQHAILMLGAMMIVADDMEKEKEEALKSLSL